MNIDKLEFKRMLEKMRDVIVENLSDDDLLELDSKINNLQLEVSQEIRCRGLES